MSGKPSLSKFNRERSRYIHVSVPLKKVKEDVLIPTPEGLKTVTIERIVRAVARGYTRVGPFPPHISQRRIRQWGLA